MVVLRRSLPFRRALAAASFIITLIFLLRHSHSLSPSPVTSASNVGPSTKSSQVLESTGQNSNTKAVSESEQQPLRGLENLSLYEKLAYEYPYDVESKFPAYIWQTWKWTPAQTEFQFRDQESTWTTEHPGFVHEVITDAVAVHLLRVLYAAVPEVLEAYEALPMPVLRADFFRYLILLARGGIYSDIDTYAIRSALEWIPKSVPRSTVGLVIGIEADPDRTDWADWYSRRIQFCQWTIEAKPGHPVLREVVSRIVDETLSKKRDGRLKKFSDKSVIEFTGPALWTDAIFQYLNDARYFDKTHSKGEVSWRNFTGMETAKVVGDVVVLPITSFSPGVQQMGAKDYDDPMAFVKHDFEGMRPKFSAIPRRDF